MMLSQINNLLVVLDNPSIEEVVDVTGTGDLLFVLEVLERLSILFEFPCKGILRSTWIVESSVLGVALRVCICTATCIVGVVGADTCATGGLHS